jgi:PadR family transcriptional regulator, regulatory protein AphA
MVHIERYEKDRIMFTMELRLTPTSFVVLGLIELMQPATPYDLKRAASEGISNLWALPHTQLYSECGRLATAGLLSEERENDGRRRRMFSLTEAGFEALEAWRQDPTTPAYELRDAGLVKLFCGADPERLAETQIEAHESRLAHWQEMRDSLAESGGPRGVRLALESGIGHEREYVRFWTAVRDGELD